MLGERRIYKRNLAGIFRVVPCSVTQLFNSFATPGTVAHQAPLSKEFSVKNTGVGLLLKGLSLALGARGNFRVELGTTVAAATVLLAREGR